MHNYADDEGANAEYGDKWSEFLHALHFLQQYAADDEHKAVAGVAHTHRKEEQEEDGQIRSRVKLIVVGPSIHICQSFKLLDELIVPELDGGIILHRGFR